MGFLGKVIYREDDRWPFSLYKKCCGADGIMNQEISYDEAEPMLFVTEIEDSAMYEDLSEKK